MRLEISHKIFISIALMVVISLMGMSLLMQHRLEQGFLAYINQLEQSKLDRLAERLGEIYLQEGDWSFLRQPPHRLAVLFQLDQGEHPRHHSDRLSLENKPPKRQDRSGRENRRRISKRSMNLMSRLTVLDKNKNQVYGRSLYQENPTVQELQVEGQLIGYLMMKPLPALNDELDLQFAKEQRNSAYRIALWVLLIAMPLSFYLSRLLVKPVRRIAAAAQQLRLGQYQTRLEVSNRDELGELASDVNRLAQTLDKNRQAQQTWLADISHELRTPVSILQGEIEALRDGVRVMDHFALGSLYQETQRLKRLVDDVYQLATSDSGALNYEMQELNLSVLLKDCVMQHQHHWLEDGLELQVDMQTDLMIKGDEQRLGQLFNNLAANSRRYTDSPGHISIRLRQTAQKVRLCWEDSSPGVPETALAHLFERLYRVESSRSRATGGTGLGLSICASIAVAHGAQITARASELGGLKIEVVFNGE